METGSSNHQKGVKTIILKMMTAAPPHVSSKSVETEFNNSTKHAKTETPLVTMAALNYVKLRPAGMELFKLMSSVMIPTLSIMTAARLSVDKKHAGTRFSNPKKTAMTGIIRVLMDVQISVNLRIHKTTRKSQKFQ